MKKKKRKQFIKLNNKARELFGGDPFDEGIVTLSDDELMELVLLLNLGPDSLERNEALRAVRRVWSEGGYTLRKAIIDHLSGKESLMFSKSANRPTDKVDKILALLEPYGCSKDEECKVLESFIDSRPAKITPEKIGNRLNYLRLQERTKTLEEALEVTLTTLGEMEFYQSYTFDLHTYSFSKKLLTRSNPLRLTALLAKSDEEIIAELHTIKSAAIEEKTEEIGQFLGSLEPHRYLDSDAVFAHMKQLPIEGNLLHNPIDSRIVESIIQEINPHYFVMESRDHIIVEKRKSTDLFTTSIDYRLSVSYDKGFIYALIWKGDDLPIVMDLDALNESTETHFATTVSALYEELLELSVDLDVKDAVVQKQMIQFLEPQLISSGNLKIKEKTKRRIHYHFTEYLRPLKERKLREELLAKTIRDFKNLFPLARSLRRKITFHAGPTNSGKTYQAMQRLKKAETGYYLAPLRLLALEGYENLREQGVAISLITGEEEIIDEESTHISSTIEMLNGDVDVDVCVIDEIQMINDRDRGWAWANALIGAPAKEVILTGSIDAVKAISEVVAYLGEELDVKYFERMNPLEVMPRHTLLKNIQEKTAIVAFSRKEVLSLKQQLSGKYHVSVVYGNLSPEVRREEARRFREGESEVLVATDAIAMGLNLPIKTILFARDNKFDGLRRRELTVTEVLQISGRAGRYGIHERGYVGALSAAALQTIGDRFCASSPDIELPFSVMASLNHVVLIGEILETDDLLQILEFFADNMEFEGPFQAVNIDSMLEVAAVVGEYSLDLCTRYHLACAPVSINSPYIESVFHRYLAQLEKGHAVPYIPPRELPPYAHTNEELLNAEDRVKEVSLYLWLSFKFTEQFQDTAEAIASRKRLNSFIEKSLQRGDFVKRCRRCNQTLDFSYRFSICEKCYRKGKQGVNRRYPK